MKNLIQALILVLCFSSCTVSSIFRPGRQIVPKGLLNKVKDTVKVVTVFSYSNSSGDNRHFKTRVAENQGEVIDSIKFVKSLDTFLSKRILHYPLVMNPINYNFVDSILDGITKYNDVDNDIDLSYELSKNIKDSGAILIIYARFNFMHGISSSTLGSPGDGTDKRQIISHAILMNKGALLYHRSNMISSVFRGNKFYQKSVSRVLNDAFKK